MDVQCSVKNARHKINTEINFCKIPKYIILINLANSSNYLVLVDQEQQQNKLEFREQSRRFQCETVRYHIILYWYF